MKEYKHIENENMYPDKKQHVEYAEVYRATKNADLLKVEDFLPSNVENCNQRRTFGNQFDQSSYGVSLFTKLESLKEKMEKCPRLDKRIKAYAKGFTTIKRGVSLKENSFHHVDYYLYDYENNSPKDDFKIIEVKNV